MLENQLLGTATIMKSQTPKAVNLTREKIMQKCGTGFSEQTVRNDNKINVVQWFYQKYIFIASTKLRIEPQDECRRWKKESKYLQIPRPNIIKCYN